MSKKSILNRTIRRTKNFMSKALGTEFLKPAIFFIMDSTSAIWEQTKRSKIKYESADFDEIKSRYDLSDEDIQLKCRKYSLQCAVLTVIATIVFLTACCRIDEGLSLFINYLLVSGVLYVFAFRMHFFRFLLLRRRLDLRVADWFWALLRGEI